MVRLATETGAFVTGRFVVFEGGDGVGKSTQQGALVAALKARGVDVVATHQPGATAAGDQIRRILLDPATGDLAPRAEALLYAADKAHHLYQVVLPALRRGAVVVCDRYVDSMLAYQGAGRRLVLAEVEYLAGWATDGLQPDLTIVLDMPAAHAIGAINAKDRLEDAGEAFHEAVRQYFLQRAAQNPDRYLVLPARADRAELSAQIEQRVMEVVENVGTYRET